MPEPMAAPAMIQAKDRLIVALDIESGSKAWGLVNRLTDHVGGFKVGLQLFTAAGPGLLRELTDAGHRIFLDLKFHDIPNTVAQTCIEAARMRVWMFNLHAMGGNEMMKKAVYETGNFCDREGIARPRIIAVTVLTSSSGDALREIGIEGSVETEVVRLACLAQRAGLDGVVASAEEAPAVRAACGNDFLIVSPGIRPKNASFYDQKRVMTPAGAINAGSDYIVVGRPITESSDVAAASGMIVDEIANAANEYHSQ